MTTPLSAWADKNREDILTEARQFIVWPFCTARIYFPTRGPWAGLRKQKAYFELLFQQSVSLLAPAEPLLVLQRCKEKAVWLVSFNSIFRAFMMGIFGWSRARGSGCVAKQERSQGISAYYRAACSFLGSLSVRYPSSKGVNHRHDSPHDDQHL